MKPMMNHSLLRPTPTLFLLFALGLIFGCAARTDDPTHEISEAVRAARERRATPDSDPAQVRRPGTLALQDLPNKRASLRSGLINRGSKRPGELPDQEDPNPNRPIILSLDKADAADAARQIFGERLKLNYVLDPNLKGEISLHVQGEYSGDELLDITSKAFRAAGVDIVTEDGVVHVRPMQKGGSGIGLAGGAAGRGPAVFVFRLRYAKAQEIQKVVKHFLAPDRPLNVDPLTNSVIFVEDPGPAANILDVLKSLDVDVLNEVGMEIVPLRALNPADAVKSLDKVVNKLGLFKNGAMKENLAYLALEHFKGVLLLSPDPRMITVARDWLVALDTHGVDMGEQVYVYQVKNGLAKNIADILNQIYENKKGDKTEAKATLEQKAVEAEERTRRPAAIVPESGMSTELSGRVLIIADEINNSIVIRANSGDMVKVKAAVQALDILPRAVLIQVVIAEVGLVDQLRYGVEWFLRSNSLTIGNNDAFAGSAFSSGGGLNADLSLTDTAGLIPQGLSLFAGSIAGVDSFAAVIHLLDLDNNVHILSTPTLLAMDNAPASITVGGREPTLSRVSQNVASDQSIVSNVTYEDTGIILNVTPHINSGGLIRLDVEQQIRTVNEQQLLGVDLNTPRFNERLIKTSLIARDGKTVVIGGIMQTRGSKIKTGVPILKHVPIISFFASTTEKRYEKTELIVAITPYLVNRREEDPVAQEFVNKLNDLKRRIREAE